VVIVVDFSLGNGKVGGNKVVEVVVSWTWRLELYSPRDGQGRDWHGRKGWRVTENGEHTLCPTPHLRISALSGGARLWANFLERPKIRRTTQKRLVTALFDVGNTKQAS